MGTDVFYSHKTHVWETPKEFFDKVDAEFHFDLDVCALPENAKCKKYFTPEDDGLSQPWFGTCWCNPPYDKGVIEKWIQKALWESFRGVTTVMLIPAKTSNEWFHEYVLNHAEIRYVLHRLKFGGCKDNAPFSSILVIYHGVHWTGGMCL